MELVQSDCFKTQNFFIYSNFLRDILSEDISKNKHSRLNKMPWFCRLVWCHHYAWLHCLYRPPNPYAGDLDSDCGKNRIFKFYVKTTV